MNHKLLALYSLKFNPFSPELPVDAIYVPSKIESFCWRIEHAQIREGGFAMVHGDPGSGKSIVLRVLAERLKKLPDVTVGAINHPQSNLADFYRELGDVFGVPLRPSNRWGGFKALRARWLAHMESTRCRAVLLVDEAQEMTPQVLSELRLLASASFALIFSRYVSIVLWLSTSFRAICCVVIPWPIISNTSSSRLDSASTGVCAGRRPSPTRCSRQFVIRGLR